MENDQSWNFRTSGLRNHEIEHVWLVKSTELVERRIFLHDKSVKWWWHVMKNPGIRAGYWPWWNVRCYLLVDILERIGRFPKAPSCGQWRKQSWRRTTLGLSHQKNHKKNVILKIKLNHPILRIKFWCDIWCDNLEDPNWIIQFCCNNFLEQRISHI